MTSNILLFVLYHPIFCLCLIVFIVTMWAEYAKSDMSKEKPHDDIDDLK